MIIRLILGNHKYHNIYDHAFIPIMSFLNGGFHIWERNLMDTLYEGIEELSDLGYIEIRGRIENGIYLTKAGYDYLYRRR